MTGTVTPFPNAPKRLRPEYQIRWLMSNIDKITDLAFVVKFDGSNPMTSASDKCNPYFLTMAAMLLNEMAANSVEWSPQKPKP